MPDPDRPGCTMQGRRVPCDEGRGCVDGTCAGRCTRPEIVLVVDRSSSMEGDRWDIVADTVGEFCELVGDTARVFLRLFPAADQCGAGVIRPCEGRPDEAPSPVGETPIAAALTGIGGTFGDPNEAEAVVLITDGDETCDGEFDALPPVAEMRRADTETFAIGVTRQVNGDLLAAIAEAGGTTFGLLGYYRVDDRPELAGALLDVYARLGGCECGEADAAGPPGCFQGRFARCLEAGAPWDLIDGPEEACDCPEPGTLQCADGEFFRCVADRWAWVPQPPAAECGCAEEDLVTCAGDRYYVCREGAWADLDAPPAQVCGCEIEGDVSCVADRFYLCEDGEWRAVADGPDATCGCQVEGAVRCVADAFWRCEGRRWHVQAPPGAGCACAQEGLVRCAGDVFFTCEQAAWVPLAAGPGPTCGCGAEGERACLAGRLYECLNGVWGTTDVPPDGQDVCDGRCVDLATDDAHCGRCDNACPQGRRCQDGECAGGGFQITPGEWYGHHGDCEGWNDCGSADGCALLACRHHGYAGLDHWEETCTWTEHGPCNPAHLFRNNNANDLDENWGDRYGGSCALELVGGIWCVR